jgi:hypothetical protein
MDIVYFVQNTSTHFDEPYVGITILPLHNDDSMKHYIGIVA